MKGGHSVRDEIMPVLDAGYLASYGSVKAKLWVCGHGPVQDTSIFAGHVASAIDFPHIASPLHFVKLVHWGQ